MKEVVSDLIVFQCSYVRARLSLCGACVVVHRRGVHSLVLPFSALWAILTWQEAKDVMKRLNDLRDAFFGVVDDKYCLPKTQHVYYVREQVLANDDDESLRLSGLAGFIRKGHVATQQGQIPSTPKDWQMSDCFESLRFRF